MSNLKILLVNPQPHGSLSPPFPVLPLGIACIAAIARESCADVKVITGPDAPTEIINTLADWQPDCVGFQTFINTVSICITMAETVRKTVPEAFILCGGVQASNDPETFLKCSAIDAVIPGEGEMIFRQLLNRLPGSAPENTPGLIHRSSDGSLITNSGKCLYENLDDLPPVPYDLFYGSGQTPVGQMLTHRGCPFHCSHCPLRFRAGVPIRSHSVERVVDTIKMLQRTYQVRHIEFFDENFTMDHDHVRGICDGIRDLDVTFNCTARISQVSEDLCQYMARAGCSSITFGLGTGVRRLQDILGTHEDLDHARSLIGSLKPMGIQPIAVFSMGVPTETRSEFDATINYAFSLGHCIVRFEPAAPLPGSQLHKTAQSGGRFLIDSWDEYVRPNQLVYLPAGRRKTEFLYHLYKAKLKARLKQRQLKIRINSYRETP